MSVNRFFSATAVAFALAMLPLQEARAQNQASPLQVDLDHATFAYSDGSSLVEVYLAFDAKSLTYQDYSGMHLALLPVVSSMRRSTEASLEGTPLEPVWQDTTTISFVVEDTSGIAAGQYFVHQIRSTVPPGEYEMDLIIAGDDSLGRSEMNLRRDVVVPDYSEASEVRLSDITLASAIVQSSDRTSAFYKNGLDIRPNANQLYGSGLTTVYYYAEAYNLAAEQVGGDQYTMLAYISEANVPQPLPGLTKRLQRPVRSPDVLVGTFDIGALASGSYFLRIALLNAENEALVEQSRKFFVFNPDVERAPVIAEEVSFENSEFASMSEEEVDEEIEHISVIATDRERRRARGIEDLDERRRFLLDFWSKRDPNPGTRTNEFREEFFRRLQYANERYASSFTDGWKSDRGRVMLKYGVPSNIEPHLYDRGYRPYELWQYNSIAGEGQALFVFADMQGFGDFELLHSTVSSERKSPDWQAEVRQGQ